MHKKDKNAVLKNHKLLLKTLKKYIDVNLNSKWCTILNLKKQNDRERPVINQILQELNISEDDYYEVFSISSDSGLQIHFKRDSNACFMKNYFIEGLKSLESKY